MTTLEKIRADIKNQLFVGRILNSKDFDDGLKWCLKLIDKYAEQEPCEKCEVGNPCLYCKHEFEQEPCEENHEEKPHSLLDAYFRMRAEQEPCEKCEVGNPCLYCEHEFGQKQEPCDDAQERYEDLCEYFGDAKNILKSRKDFKAWLERIKWHIHKAEELYEKYECKEPCTDAVSRQAVLEIIKSHVLTDDYAAIQELPSVRPQEQTGHCKDCKYFEYDKWLYINEMPAILAHEVCNRWQGGWKTKEDGFCFMFERGDTE